MSLREICRPVVVGDTSVIDLPTGIEMVDVKALSGAVEPGRVSADAGRASGRYIETAVEL
jgi:hypothetical protein